MFCKHKTIHIIICKTMVKTLKNVSLNYLGTILKQLKIKNIYIFNLKEF